MNFKAPYIVIRMNGEGKAEVVHSAEKVKDARYWLQYIALPGDAVFQTPAHPKNEGKPEPTYYAHLVARGKIEHDEQKWRNQTLQSNALEFVAAAA